VGCSLLLSGMWETGIFIVSDNTDWEENWTDGIAIMLYNDKQRKEAEEAVHRMVKRAVEMEGTVTGEHGVGLVKRDYLNHELGETTVDAMRKVRPDPGMWFVFMLTFAA